MSMNEYEITPRRAATISAEQVATVRDTIDSIDETIASKDRLLLAAEELRMHDTDSEQIQEIDDHIRHATARIMDNQLFLGRVEDSVKNFGEAYRDELHTAALAEAALDGVNINHPNAIK
jgi:hypothetical protein